MRHYRFFACQTHTNRCLRTFPMSFVEYGLSVKWLQMDPKAKRTWTLWRGEQITSHLMTETTIQPLPMWTIMPFHRSILVIQISILVVILGIGSWIIWTILYLVERWHISIKRTVFQAKAIGTVAFFADVIKLLHSYSQVRFAREIVFVLLIYPYIFTVVAIDLYSIMERMSRDLWN